MDKDTWKILIGAIVGIIVMLAMDYSTGKIFNSIYAIPISVLMGALVAGYIAKVHTWIPGLVVGLVSSGITIAIYFLFSPQIDASEHAEQITSIVQTAMLIVSLNIACGVVGGAVGGNLRKQQN